MRDVKRRPNRPLALLALILAVVTPACARRPQAGVNVKPLTTDLSFGVPEVDDKGAPPPNTSPSADEPVVVSDFGGFSQGGDVPSPPPPPAAPVTDCPQAPPTKFPRQAAPTEISAPPQAGRYEYRVDGKQQVQQLGTVPLPRVIVKTVRTPGARGNNFNFTITEREIVFGSSAEVTQTFQVRQAEGAVEENGVFLTKIERKVGAQGQTRVFQPQPPIQYIPLPVTIGSPGVGYAEARVPTPQMDTTGVDPSSLETLRHRGTVTQRMTVDACGEPLQAFLVDATQEFVSQDGTATTRDYNYGVATHYGGLIIFEHVESPCRAQNQQGACTPPGDLIFDSRIGQTAPTP